MKKLGMALLMASLFACNKGQPVPTTAANPEDSFSIVKLFDVEGCTVYRFLDMGYYRYFSTCAGKITSQICHSAGKAQSCHPDDISTGVK